MVLFRFFSRFTVVKCFTTFSFLVSILLTLIWLADTIWPMPDLNVQNAKIVVADDGTPLWRFADNNGVWRYSVSLDEVSPYYLEALLAYEDRWFYYHPGVNPLSIIRAAWQNITNQRVISGGSTISMQVARLIEPHQKTFMGKLHQVFRTFQLEWYYSKDEILTLYINRAPYGGTLEGIGAASWSYLDKPPSNLTQAEAALLVILPQAPSRLRPDRYPVRAQQARNKVLDRLKKYHIWNDKQVEEIKQEPIWIAERQAPQLAPLLAYRLAASTTTDVIDSTINIALQRRIEDIAMNWKNQLPASTSMGILVVEKATMSVKAYLGSADFNDTTRFGHVDMIQAWRSPGSTLKPFLYAMALDDGLIHSASLLQDVPRQFSDYRPSNFDTGFNGPVSVIEALTRSLNLPAVQLLEVYGPKRFTANLRNADIELRFPAYSEPNLSLILGGTGVKMDNLLSAYSAFARDGKVAKLRFQPQDPLIEKPLFSAGAAWIVRQILEGKSPTTHQSLLEDRDALAIKTGTSYGYRDAWAIGINADYLIGVWVGRPDATPVAGQYGNATAVPILNNIHQLLINRTQLNNRTEHSLSVSRPPASVSQTTICWPQGQSLAKDDKNCRQQHKSWIVDGTIPPTLAITGQEQNSSSWLTIWVNQQGQRVAADCSNARAERLALWPIALESWLPESEHRAARLPNPDPSCPPHGNDITPPLLILGLKDGSIVKRLPNQPFLNLQLTTQGGKGKRWWFINGEMLMVTAENQPLSHVITAKGKYQISVLDESGQVANIKFSLD